MEKIRKIAVIGAGFAGLSAAFDLRKLGHDVVLFEASDIPGGLASGFKEPHWDWSVERYYHHWFQTDSHLLGLMEELGLSDQVIYPKPVSVMYHKGKFHPFDSIISALLYPGLGWGIHKIRFGLVGLYLRFTKNWQAFEKVTTDEWMRKKAGNFAFESMWKPMLDGKFGENWADKVNMAWMWARLHVRTTRLGNFVGGFQRFLDLFAERLQSDGVDLRYNTAVEEIRKDPDGGLTVQFGQGQTERFDQVLVTLSPRAMTKLAPELPEDYLAGLLNLKHMGALVLTI